MLATASSVRWGNVRSCWRAWVYAAILDRSCCELFLPNKSETSNKRRTSEYVVGSRQVPASSSHARYSSRTPACMPASMNSPGGCLRRREGDDEQERVGRPCKPKLFGRAAVATTDLWEPFGSLRRAVRVGGFAGPSETAACCWNERPCCEAMWSQSSACLGPVGLYVSGRQGNAVGRTVPTS